MQIYVFLVDFVHIARLDLLYGMIFLYICMNIIVANTR